jgi:hypothetical protein
MARSLYILTDNRGQDHGRGFPTPAVAERANRIRTMQIPSFAGCPGIWQKIITETTDSRELLIWSRISAAFLSNESF